MPTRWVEAKGGEDSNLTVIMAIFGDFLQKIVTVILFARQLTPNFVGVIVCTTSVNQL